jgi:hypothetical protein
VGLSCLLYIVYSIYILCDTDITNARIVYTS